MLSDQEGLLLRLASTVDTSFLPVAGRIISAHAREQMLLARNPFMNGG